MQAAIKQAAERVSASHVSAPEPGVLPGAASTATSGAQAPDFAQALEAGLARVDQQVHSAESMPLDLLTGKIDDFHQIAVQLKSAELSFKFAMEIRNKLVDAYREIMRMSV
ncbi:MAG: flagellar hook-basal body complex protein FliE [Planctomycetes bacterium]|nr:flagellar hook-basal body complex protein FliE [Planctomycetota bacterium]